MQKLSRTVVPRYTTSLVLQQKGVCPLCTYPLLKTVRGGLVLDHEHSTGEVRGVLCRWCNGVLGKVEGWANRAKGELSHLKWLENALQYLSQPGKGVIYHLHKTGEEKVAAKRLQARKAYAAKRAAATLRGKNSVKKD